MALQTALQNLRNKKIPHGQLTSQKSDELPVLGLEKNEDQQRSPVAAPSSTAVCKTTGAPPKQNSPAAAAPMVSDTSLQRLKSFKFTKVQAPLVKNHAEDEDHTFVSKRRAVCSDVTNAEGAEAICRSSKPITGTVGYSITSVAANSTVIDYHNHGHRSGPSGGTSGRCSVGTSGLPSGGTSGLPSGGTSGLPSGGTSGLPSGGTSGLPSGGTSGLPSGRTSGLPSGGTSGLPSRGTSGLPSGRTSGRCSGGTSGLPSGGTSGLPSGETSGLPSRGTSGLPSGGTSGLPSGGTSGLPSGGTSGLPSGGTSGLPSRGTSGLPSGGTSGLPSGSAIPSPWTTGVANWGKTDEYEVHFREQLFDDFDVDTFLSDADPDVLAPTDIPSSPLCPSLPAPPQKTVCPPLPAPPQKTMCQTSAGKVLDSPVPTATAHHSQEEVAQGTIQGAPSATPPRRTHTPCAPGDQSPLLPISIAASGGPQPIQLEMMSTPSRTPPSSAVCRKFPGPAGLLPLLGPGQGPGNAFPPSPRLPSAMSHVQKTSGAVNFPTGRRGNTAHKGESEQMDFTKGPWVRMMEDLDMRDPHSAALLQFNVAALLKQASRHQLQHGKVTHLRVMLRSLCPVSSKGNTTAVLTDPTGEVLCALHHKVVEDHQKELTPGAVLVLRQVSVFSPAPRKHYLSVTPDNIIRIYPAGSEDVEKRPLCLADANKKQTGLRSLHREGSGQVAGYDNTVATTLCQTSVESVASVFSSAICDDEFDQLVGDVTESLDF